MRYLKTLLVLLPIAMLFSNCTHKATERDATLQVSFKHHEVGKNLINCTLYIKYNTQDAPANGIYDDSAVAKGGVVNDSLQTATIQHLANGNYYLYGTGYDTSISQRVKGSTVIVISQQNLQTVDIPVSEY